MFINQYTSLKSLLKLSSFLICLFINKKNSFIFLFNNKTYTVVKLPMKYQDLYLFLTWQIYRFHKIIFIDGLVEQKYLVNKAKCLITRPLCLKTFYFIYNRNHALTIINIMFHVRSLYSMHMLFKKIILYFNSLKTFKKNYLKLLKFEIYQTKILGNIFYKGIRINLFLLKIFILFKIFLAKTIQIYFVINFINIHNIFTKHKKTLVLINIGVNQLLKKLYISKINSYFLNLLSISGRISCANPNIQGLSKNQDLRKCIQAKTNDIFLSGDFESYELRIVAAMSRDNKLTLDLSNLDFYSRMSFIFFKRKTNKCVNYSLRLKIKIIIFSIIYGMNIHALADNIYISNKTSKNIISIFLSKYSYIKTFFSHLLMKSRKNKEINSVLKKSY